jgi:hypothetical protein
LKTSNWFRHIVGVFLEFPAGEKDTSYKSRQKSQLVELNEQLSLFTDISWALLPFREPR